jgi:hypothetical protein
MIGIGILKGMAVTARNFAGSYFEKDRLTTVQYPEERLPLPENSRNFPSSFTTPMIRKPVCAVLPARSAKRNARRSAFTSSKVTTRSPITWASRNFIQPPSISTFRFA